MKQSIPSGVSQQLLWKREDRKSDETLICYQNSRTQSLAGDLEIFPMTTFLKTVLPEKYSVWGQGWTEACLSLLTIAISVEALHNLASQRKREYICCISVQSCEMSYRTVCRGWGRVQDSKILIAKGNSRPWLCRRLQQWQASPCLQPPFPFSFPPCRSQLMNKLQWLRGTTTAEMKS